MYLSKLELFGFKSFANKTKLKFDDGIACVIGPNGSGKSNIVDAIRWVLGEQKVTTLRSDKMESVIFNGSKKRKPLSLAEVNLTIQNNKKILDSPFSEVVISRRLYRNGESQYLMNKTPCRLKDIMNLFMDTGMNANSYSVIELKMVESIISENPEERRILFEEAAGVTKYKARRKSAIRKLNATKSDMSRISDMIAEITRTVNSLSRQVGKARRYLKFQDEVKTKETDLARYNFNILQDDIIPLENNLKEISAIKEDTTHQITLEETLLEDYKQEIIQFEQKLSNINKQIFDYDKEIQNIQEEEAVSKTRIESLQETKTRNIVDIKEFEIKQSNLKVNGESLKKEIQELSTSIEKIEEGYNVKYKKHEELVVANKSKKDKIDKLEIEHKSILENLSSSNEKKQNLIYKLNWNEDQLKKIKNELNEIDKNNNQSLMDIEEYKNQKDKIKKSVAAQSETYESLKSNSIQLDLELDEINVKLTSLKSKEELIKSKIQFFKNVIENYEGHFESTKYLMQNKSSFPGLIGPLSNFITVDSKYDTAVEATLGSSINYLVVDNTSTALSILDDCKKLNLGRVSILPLERIKNLKSEPLNSNLNILSNLIETSDKFNSIFRILFGDVAIVSDLNEALSLVNDYPNLRFVTLSGETVNFNLGITGGNSSKNDNSLIGRENKLRKFNSDLETVIDDFENQNTILNRKLKDKNSLGEKLNINKIAIEELSNNLVSVEQNISQMTFVKENRITIKNAKESELDTIKSNIKKINLAINEESGHIKDVSNQIAEYEDKISLASSASEKEMDQLDKIGKEVQEIKLNLVNLQNNFQLKENDHTRIKETISELTELSDKRKNENENIDKEILEKQSNSIERQKLKEQIYEKRDKIDSDKESFEVKYHEIRDKILNLESQIKKYRKQHDSSLERTRQLELNIQENKMKSEVIKERIQEEYNIDISIGIPYEGINAEEYEQNIETLKFKIKQLGQVNPLAVNEYDTESKRLDFYKKQYDDLEQAIDSLQKTIDKINLTARKQFKETFGLIKTNFEKVFSNFFVNGEGSLALEEGVDPLEADIEIFVRPKGRRVQTLNLLSGGEKTLTAISLLFSIYLVKPSPFCILDEIDAPLDDVNIRRFTDALHSFSNDTQFIVITHNKRTMEAADTLYGVTMEEEGLSKLVSVKFN